MIKRVAASAFLHVLRFLCLLSRSSYGVHFLHPAVAGIRMQSLFFPSLPSDIMVLALALAGQAAASRAFALLLATSPLGKGLVASPADVAAAAAPDACVLIMLIIAGGKPAVVQQAGALLARMCLWGPIAQAAQAAAVSALLTCSWLPSRAAGFA